MISDVEVITIGEGVIVYQCEKGLVPEGRVEAMCGDDGKWSPDPTQHMCIAMTTTTSTDSTSATSTDITRQDLETEPPTNINTQNGVSISITVGVTVAVALVFSMGGHDCWYLQDQVSTSHSHTESTSSHQPQSGQDKP